MVRIVDNSGRMASVNESLLLLRELARMAISGEENLPGQQIKIRDDQVQNNAGGFVFQVSDLTRVRRFLILGTNDGTYYVTEKALTIQNLESLIEIIKKGKGGMILREILAISLAGRAPKQNALLFALALCARYNVRDRIRRVDDTKMEVDGNDELLQLDGAPPFNEEEKKKFDAYLHNLQQTAMKMVGKVCRIPTHLFMFVKYAELVASATNEKGSTGWGRAMRKCISQWYLEKSPKELALHITKYPSRERWSHRDLLRLAHPMASLNNRELANDQTLVYDQIFHYACFGEFDAQKETLVDPLEAVVPSMKKARCDYAATQPMITRAQNSEALEFIRRAKELLALKAGDESAESRCVELIQKFDFVREHVPTALLNSPKVWTALLQKMPMTALLRNLSKLATLELLNDKKNKDCVDSVIAKLLNQDALQRARVHPISVLLASSVYKKGCGIKGKLQWETNERIVDALEQCFLLAFKNVQPTGKRFCLAFDVSGSMDHSHIGGGSLSCRDGAAAMGNVTLRTEENVCCVAFQTELTQLPFTQKSTFMEMVKYMRGLPFGGTDCSLPMIWATEQRLPFDVFVVYTDSETWAGEEQPFVALKNYREKMQIPDAKLVVMGMEANEFTIADPTDPGMLDIVGLDASVPELLRAFVLNEL